MKKKIISILVLSMYFFGGIGMVFAADQDDATGVDAAVYKNSKSDGKTDAQASADAGGYIPPSSGGNSPADSDGGGPNDMTSTDFTLNPNDLSPSEKKYTAGTKVNLKTILANIGKYLLIATTTIAVLSIVIGGLMISTTGPTDRAAKGKTIIMLNIMAVIVALFSYSIIKLV